PRIVVGCYDEISAGLENPVHFGKSRTLRVQPWDNPDCDHQVEHPRRESQGMHVGCMKPDTILHTMILSVPPRYLQHGGCRIQRVHRITVTRQGDCEQPGTAPGFENPRV